MTDSGYTPISCAAHDRLLALATLRQECELSVRAADGSTASIHGVIVDLFSRAGAEYLVLRDGTTLRLDQLQALNGQPIRPA